MEKQQGKDYFGFQGQAESYAKYRPQYPKEFLQKVVTQHVPTKKELCIDLATGTGFLAAHMSEYFDKVLGLDISDA